MFWSLLVILAIFCLTGSIDEILELLDSDTGFKGWEAIFLLLFWCWFAWAKGSFDCGCLLSITKAVRGGSSITWGNCAAGGNSL